MHRLDLDDIPGALEDANMSIEISPNRFVYGFSEWGFIFYSALDFIRPALQFI
jgi:hypothetical protein